VLKALKRSKQETTRLTFDDLTRLNEARKGSIVKRPPSESVTDFGTGADLKNIYKEVPIRMRDVDRSGHFGCFGTTRVGKAQPLDALVHTPFGWQKMKDIRVGGKVTSPTGEVSNVIGVFPQGKISIYRVSFEDGRFTRACGDHLWETDQGRMTTLAIGERLKTGAVLIPLSGPVEKLRQDLPLKPRKLGRMIANQEAWSVALGAKWLTGSREAVSLPVADGLDWMKAYLCELADEVTSSLLRGIPRPYLESSVADRLELLEGIANGRLLGSIFCTSMDMAETVQELIWSLGGIARIKSADGGGYTVQVDSLPFVEPGGKKWLRMTAVEPCGEDFAQCIALDTEDGLYITNDYIVTHNTRVIENIVEQDIRKGYNVVVVDPKGDVDLFSKIVEVAADCGRLYDLLLLTPIYPQVSIMLDPLAYYYMEDELVDHVISGIKAKEEYFINVAAEVTQAVISAFDVLAKAQGKRMHLSMYDIKTRVNHGGLQQLLQAVKVYPGSSEVCLMLEQILESPADFFAKVSSSLRTVLTSLTTGRIGHIIGKAKTNEFVRRFETGEGVILICHTGSLLARRTAHIVGRLLISMIQSAVGRFFSSGRKLDPPLCIHIDEGHNILYKGIQELFNKGGGANVWVHFYTQSIAQIVDEVGDETARSIIDNINTWMFMLVNHPETAKFVEDASPPTRKYNPILSVGGGISIREVEDKMICVHNVLELQKREFYMRSYGRLFRGTTAEVKNARLKVVFPRVGGSATEDPAL